MQWSSLCPRHYLRHAWSLFAFNACMYCSGIESVLQTPHHSQSSWIIYQYIYIYIYNICVLHLIILLLHFRVRRALTGCDQRWPSVFLGRWRLWKVGSRLQYDGESPDVDQRSPCKKSKKIIYWSCWQHVVTQFSGYFSASVGIAVTARSWSLVPQASSLKNKLARDTTKRNQQIM